MNMSSDLGKSRVGEIVDIETDEAELLPCPFCGSADAHFVGGEDEDGDWVAVACPGCGCGSRQHYSIMEDARPFAASAWNQRSPLTPPGGQS